MSAVARRHGPFVLVVGHRPRVESPEGSAAMLRQLGAEVHTQDLWDDFGTVVERARSVGEAAGDGVRGRRAAGRPRRRGAPCRSQKLNELAETPTLIALPPRQITPYDPSSGFDDFIIVPCVPAEIYARIRALEWRRSEFATEERVKIGAVVVDRAAHGGDVDSRHVTLTAKEFALLAFLAANRGRVYSRDALLARVWGNRYEGGARTVDIHVRRLRAKLGDALPLETLRGAGYKMRAPSEQAKR